MSIDIEIDLPYLKGPSCESYNLCYETYWNYKREQNKSPEISYSSRKVLQIQIEKYNTYRTKLTQLSCI